MSLETKCRALMRKLRTDAEDYGQINPILDDCASELQRLLPKRRPKKRKEVARYGPPPSTLVERKRKRKMK